jgi:hypothetical protein
MSLERNKTYWTALLKITYTLLFFEKMTLKQISYLKFDQIHFFVDRLEDPWKTFFKENLEILSFEIKLLKKSNPKKYREKDTLLLSTYNALYRAVNRDLKYFLGLLKLDDQFSITAKSFQPKF